nr:DUF3995 domain-containing protein [uncultured Dyadobacter sp.]
MAYTISLVLFLIFLFLSGLHFYWGVGGRWGSKGVFPTQDNMIKANMPGIVPCFIVAIGLLGIGIFVLSKGGLLHLPLPVWLDHYGLWVIAAIFIVRAIGDFNYVGFFRKVKHTRFGKNDQKYYTPLCLAMGILAAVLAQLN